MDGYKTGSNKKVFHNYPYHFKAFTIKPFGFLPFFLSFPLKRLSNKPFEAGANHKTKPKPPPKNKPLQTKKEPQKQKKNLKNKPKNINQEQLPPIKKECKKQTLKAYKNKMVWRSHSKKRGKKPHSEAVKKGAKKKKKYLQMQLSINKITLCRTTTAINYE